MIKAKLEIELPKEKSLSELSIHFPNSTFYILSMLPTRENIGNILIKIVGNNLSQLLSKLKSHNNVLGHSIISKTPSSILINLKSRNPWLLDWAIKNEVLLEYPIQIKNGFATWEVLSSRDKLDSLFQKIKEKDLKINLKNIGKYKEKKNLTQRQLEILNIAVKEGFYEIPRRIKLTELASKLKISPSTLSEILRRINKKLLQKI